MRPFEYAAPDTETEALQMLSAHEGRTAVLAGGTDLVALMQQDVAHYERVVDVKNINTMQGVAPLADGDVEGVLIGALTTLEDASESPFLHEYRALQNAIEEVRAIQIQQNGTLGGDLCHLPNCWYYRNGYGLLAQKDGESLVEQGDNRYHAILGNRGPAKFVSASRFAPGLIALGAKVRLIGPNENQEEWLPLEYFYRTPKTESQGVTVLKPGQLLSHIWLPKLEQGAGGTTTVSATYEVLELQGLDWPQAAASCALELDRAGVVKNARIVLGHVAPIPWESREAASAVIGAQITEATAQKAAEAALASATPLKDNAYKVQQAKAAVKRTLLRAVGENV